MASPNLFLIGAPKCGTTSQHYYFAQHPEIFVCTPKEPHFFIRDTFGTDCDFMIKVRTLPEYETLFEPGKDYRYRLDSSTWHLSNPEAPSRIRQQYPNAMIMATLRNPVDRVYSDFNHRLRTATSLTKYFESEIKAMDRLYPDAAASPNNYLFHFSNYPDQVRRWQAAYPKSQLRFDLFDDLAKEPVKFTQSIFEWLSLDYDGIELKTERANAALVPARPFLHRMNEYRGGFRKIARLLLPSKVKRLYYHKGLWTKAPPRKMQLKTREMLLERYEPQLRELEGLLDRDLSHWRRLT